MNYEEKSDNELNMMVADLRGGYAGNVDYCNNPSDAWPIIVESGISLLDPEMCGATPDWCTMKFIPSYGARNVEVYNKNPLRAAMIVFLMMQETV